MQFDDSVKPDGKSTQNTPSSRLVDGLNRKDAVTTEFAFVCDKFITLVDQVERPQLRTPGSMSPFEEMTIEARAPRNRINWISIYIRRAYASYMVFCKF